MRVLLLNSRVDFLEKWGGDSTQVVKTGKYLKRLGVSVKISSDLTPNLKGYDLIHVFNIQTSKTGIQQMQHIKRYGIPVALSPIYWDLRNIDRMMAYIYPYSEKKLISILGHIHPLVPVIAKRIVRYPIRRQLWRWSKNMLEMADILLPNSYAELEVLVLLFNTPYIRAKSMIIPNSIDLEDMSNESNVVCEQVKSYGLPKEYVLEVGRIEPIKGQSTLIKALKQNADIPLVFVGRGLDTSYGKYCIKLGRNRGNTYFIGEVAHKLLSQFYRGAKVHALPSLRESPGLVTLEAAIFGANCVVSYYGPVNEYFGTAVWYCNPLDIESTGSAILEAWNAPRTYELGDKVRKEFTWENAAQATLRGYEQLLLKKTTRIFK